MHILLAENNVVSQKVMTRILEKQGHTVEVARNGKDAVTLLRQTGFDLVFMDVQMPMMNGFEATEYIRKTESIGPSSHLPIIGMSGHAIKDDEERCLKAGMDDYIIKPLKAEELSAVLARFGPSQNENKVPNDVLNISEVFARLEGDMEIFKEIWHAFKGDIPRQMSLVEQALEAGDVKKTEAQAHSIKGAAANIGAEKIRNYALCMENAAKAGDIPEMLRIHGKLIHAVKEILDIPVVPRYK